MPASLLLGAHPEVVCPGRGVGVPWLYRCCLGKFYRQRNQETHRGQVTFPKSLVSSLGSQN